MIKETSDEISPTEKSRKLRKFLPYIILATLAIIGSIVFICCDVAENKRIDAEAVTLRENLEIPFGDPAKVSDFIANLNGKFLTDPEVATDELGPVEVSFEYKNIKNKKRVRKFTITVVDVTAPTIYGRSTYTVSTNYDGELTDLILSGDNLDDHPKREIVGEYNLSKPGNYPVEYVATDASGNEARHSFTLQIVEPLPAGSNFNEEKIELSKLAFSDALKKHKTATTQVGIDISYWQEDIDWQKVKTAGAEFAIIRVGYQSEYGGELKLDKKFIDNVEGALEVGLPVGVYFYSCAQSLDNAKEQADWVKEQISDYPIKLGVAFDWENWTDFNIAGVSFRTLNRIAETFLSEISAAGYDGLLYGSKNYLEKFWNMGEYEIWRAQYNDRATYTGDYRLWQLSDTGRIDGIKTDVDIDVRFVK